MIAPLFDFGPLGAILTEESIVLTSNRRLSDQISAAYDQLQIKNGRKYWPVLPVYSLEEWIKDCWLKLVLESGLSVQGLRCLTAEQELLLWQEIIANDADNVLLKPHATAKTLQATYRVLQLWDTSKPDEANSGLSACSFLKAPMTGRFYDHPDSTQFLRWAKRFEKACREKNYICNAGIPKLLVCAFDSQLIAKPGQIILAGFQHLPPLQEQLVNRASDKVTCLPTNSRDELSGEDQLPGAQVTAYSYNSVDEELFEAALWAKEKIETSAEQRIGIIVPDLAQRRSQVERLFTSVFEPRYLLPDTPQYQPPFNISASSPLGSKPVIVTALTLLELNQPQIEVEDLFLLLNSAFIFSEPESCDALCQLQLSIRKYGWPKLSNIQIQTLLKQLIRKKGPGKYTEILEAFEQFSNLARDLTGKPRPLSTWLELFNRQLETFGWPGSRRLNSIEFQQVKRWQNALQTFSSLQTITGNVNLSQTLSLFRRHINSLDFQAESGQTPIQILGMLEGSGLAFDAIRLVGLNDHRWPVPARPNPFIPISLQIENNMPHASAERELAFSYRLFDTYLASAPETVVSYSLLEQDTSLRPSALISDYLPGIQPTAQMQPQHPYYSLVHASAQIEAYADNLGPAINLDTEPVKGGSQILKNQAACPFRAFALHRLNARALDDCSHHLSAQLRGIALHRSLEALWRELKDFDSLLALEPSQLEDLVIRSIEYALKPLARDRADLLQPGFIMLETERLKNILQQWLQQEKYRIPFKVEAIEAGMSISIAGLPLQVRIDRIDRLEDGSLMIIDYKSASSSVNQWSGERPDDPQLPAYAINYKETTGSVDDIKALAFAQINVDRQSFTGLSASQDVAPGVFPAERTKTWKGSIEWEQIIEDWRQSLGHLADQFCQGVADVAPKKSTTCRYCHLQSVCRIYEQGQRER